MITRQTENRCKRRKLEESGSSKCEQSSTTKKVPYREAIGSLMYLANGTRPDIAFAVHYLARKQLNASEDDWKNVERILRYLNGTVNSSLKYAGNSDELEAFSDASFRDNDDSTSSGGYIIRLFGDIIAWRSHKQNYVTLSTCQVEYLAMSDACQEIISLDKAIRFIIGKTLFPTTIWCDNKSANDCTKRDGSHKLKMFDNSVNEIKLELLEREKTENSIDRKK
ncbi:uncharacterized protein LOC141537221 [Cotesia typhae]|uniref:uncharacterized protein LOC141537221 n=1 Tax=Cotesia typhae TaxID=2053667 RepID=UPI003D685A5C